MLLEFPILTFDEAENPVTGENGNRVTRMAVDPEEIVSVYEDFDGSGVVVSRGGMECKTTLGYEHVMGVWEKVRQESKGRRRLWGLN